MTGDLKTELDHALIGIPLSDRTTERLLPVLRQLIADTLVPTLAALDRVHALADHLEDVARDYQHVPAGTHDAGARNAHLAIANRIRAALNGQP